MDLSTHRDAAMHGAIPPDQNKKDIIKKMMRTGEQIILEALSYSVKNNTSRLDFCVEKMDELVKLKDFPLDFGSDLKSLCRRIRRETHEKRVSDLIEEAMAATLEGQSQIRKAALDGVSAALFDAVKSGADREFCDQVAKRLEVLALTSRKGIDDQARCEAKRRTELKTEKAASGRDRRRAIRYAEPVLVFDCRGWGTYRTINWSCYGILVDGEGKPPPAVGKYLKFTLRCGLLPEFEERLAGTVVKVTPTGDFAIELPNIATEILRLMNLLKKSGVHPEAC